MQVLLVDTSEGTQISPERCACSFTGIAVDLESAIPIPCPFVDAMAYGGVGGVAAVITLALVGIDPCAAGRHVFGNQVVAGSRVRMITYPETLLTRLP
jgi:hypothetical protein